MTLRLTPPAGNCGKVSKNKPLSSNNIAALALQHGNVLLTSHGAGIVIVDNFNTGASVSSKCYQINTLSIKQSEGDGAVVVAFLPVQTPRSV